MVNYSQTLAALAPVTLLWADLKHQGMVARILSQRAPERDSQVCMVSLDNNGLMAVRKTRVVFLQGVIGFSVMSSSHISSLYRMLVV